VELKKFNSTKYMKIKKIILSLAVSAAMMFAGGIISASASAPRSIDWNGDSKVSVVDIVAAAKAGNSIEVAKIKYIIINNIQIDFDDDPDFTEPNFTDIVTDPIFTNPTGDIGTDIVTDPTGDIGSDISTEPFQTAPTTEIITAFDPDVIPDTGNIILLDFNSISYKGDAETEIDGSYITIKEPGDYELYGVLNNGRIIVDVDKTLYPDGKVSLKLNNVSIFSADGPAILCNSIDDKLVINSAKDTANFLYDGNTREVEGELDAVIYSEGDLNLKGSGQLNVTGIYADGIVSEKDIEVKTGANIEVTAQDDGIRGKNSVTLEDEDGTGFTLRVLAKEGDAIKATVTDKEGKGYVEIQGGSVTLESQSDESIQAATDVIITGGVVNITASAGNGIKTETGSVIIDGDLAYVTINSYGDGIQAEGSVRVTSGNLNISASSASDTDPAAQEETPMQRPNRLPTEETAAETTAADTVSSKGIKSTLSVNITGGTIVINSSDDAINSDFDITIGGGNLTLSSGDDAIHAEGVLAVTNAATVIEVITAYEGLEAGEIYINNGNIKLTVTNDGVNAAGGNDDSETGFAGDVLGGYAQGSGKFVMTDGTLYVNAQGDGIDSNGSLEIIGGEVVVIRNSLSMNSVFDVGDFGGTVVIAGSAEVFAIGGKNEMPVNINSTVYKYVLAEEFNPFFNSVRMVKGIEEVIEVFMPEEINYETTLYYSNQDIRTNGTDGYSTAYINNIF
jgi:hypothetical protein